MARCITRQSVFRGVCSAGVDICKGLCWHIWIFASESLAEKPKRSVLSSRHSAAGIFMSDVDSASNSTLRLCIFGNSLSLFHKQDSYSSHPLKIQPVKESELSRWSCTVWRGASVISVLAHCYRCNSGRFLSELRYAALYEAGWHKPRWKMGQIHTRKLVLARP